MQSLSSFMNTIRFNFLYIDKYSFGRTWTYPESAIPYNMLRYIIDGSAEFVVDPCCPVVLPPPFPGSLLPWTDDWV